MPFYFHLINLCPDIRIISIPVLLSKVFIPEFLDRILVYVKKYGISRMMRMDTKELNNLYTTDIINPKNPIPSLKLFNTRNRFHMFISPVLLSQ